MSDESQTDKKHTAFFEQMIAADLKVAIVWLTAIILSVYLPVLNETPIKGVLVVSGIFFLPGYCLTAALFPKFTDIDLPERIALSIGLSLAVVPLIAFVLNFTPLGILEDPVLIAVTIFTLVMILIAHYRRVLLRSEERRFHLILSFNWNGYFPDFLVKPNPESEGIAIRHIEQVIQPDESEGSNSGMVDTFRNVIFPKRQSKVDLFLSVVIALIFIIAALATIYAITVPKEGERYTEFFILGENRTAADYPGQISAGQNYSLYIGVGNHEYQNTNYTIETWLMRTEFDTVTNTSYLVAMDPKDHVSFILAHNETHIIPYNLSVENTTYNRVEFLLFKDKSYNLDLTGNDRINASFQELHLGITVR